LNVGHTHTTENSMQKFQGALGETQGPTGRKCPAGVVLSES
jgi:hypothetical protein